MSYIIHTTIEIDAGSTTDPTDRVAAALPGAFVRHAAGDAGFGGAANEALAAVSGASFFLVCHDDVALDSSAVRLLVEEAFRSNAGIVGPKLVDADKRRRGLELAIHLVNIPRLGLAGTAAIGQQIGAQLGGHADRLQDRVRRA